MLLCGLSLSLVRGGMALWQVNYDEASAVDEAEGDEAAVLLSPPRRTPMRTPNTPGRRRVRDRHGMKGLRVELRPGHPPRIVPFSPGRAFLERTCRHLQLVGEGQSSRVWRGVLAADGRHVAVKQTQERDVSQALSRFEWQAKVRGSTPEGMYANVKASWQLRHPHLVALEMAWVEGESVFQMMVRRQRTAMSRFWC